MRISADEAFVCSDRPGTDISDKNPMDEFLSSDGGISVAIATYFFGRRKDSSATNTIVITTLRIMIQRADNDVNQVIRDLLSNPQRLDDELSQLSDTTGDDLDWVKYDPNVVGDGSDELKGAFEPITHQEHDILSPLFKNQTGKPITI